MKKSLKYGISLIVLVITIIVVLTISSAVIFIGVNVSENVKLDTFLDDILKIEDAVKGYYILNDYVPTSLTESGINFDELLLSYVEARNKAELENEINLNSDKESIFYILDLSKLMVQNFDKGFLKNGNDDVYAISYPNFNVYYLKGIMAGGKYYFSNSSKIEKELDKKVENVDDSIINIIASSNMYLKKDTTSWTNKLGVTIRATINEGEELYLKVGAFDTLFPFAMSSNMLNIKFNSFEELNASGNLTILVSTDAINNFNTNKYIQVIKKKENEIVDSKTLDLANYDNVVTGNLSDDEYTYIEYNDFNALSILTASLEQSGSGVKYVKYDYLTKIDENGNEIPYYTGVNDFDKEYMLKKAKTMNVASDKIATAKIDKNVKKVKIAVVDNAGNSSLFNLVLDDAHKFVE